MDAENILVFNRPQAILSAMPVACMYVYIVVFCMRKMLTNEYVGTVFAEREREREREFLSIGDKISLLNFVRIPAISYV
jgi:hypothetical protein